MKCPRCHKFKIKPAPVKERGLDPAMERFTCPKCKYEWFETPPLELRPLIHAPKPETHF